MDPFADSFQVAMRQESGANDKATSKARILCIEDEPGMRDLLRLMLEGAGYLFLGARDGGEGLDAMRSEQPDLVLLDLMLPNVDGAELLKRKAGDPTILDIPVIAVTALSSPFDQIMWKRHTTIEDYITKPFTRRQLLETIERVLARRAGPLNTGLLPGC
jgi:CheY-like chemotaxis protein